MDPSPRINVKISESGRMFGGSTRGRMGICSIRKVNAVGVLILNL